MLFKGVESYKTGEITVDDSNFYWLWQSSIQGICKIFLTKYRILVKQLRASLTMLVTVLRFKPVYIFRIVLNWIMGLILNVFFVNLILPCYYQVLEMVSKTFYWQSRFVTKILKAWSIYISYYLFELNRKLIQTVPVYSRIEKNDFWVIQVYCHHHSCIATDLWFYDKKDTGFCFVETNPSHHSCERPDG